MKKFNVIFFFAAVLIIVCSSSGCYGIYTKLNDTATNDKHKISPKSTSSQARDTSDLSDSYLLNSYKYYSDSSLGRAYSVSNGKIKDKSDPTSNYNNDNVNTIEQSKTRCIAITKAGNQCKRDAQSNSQFCWQHQNYKNEVTEKKTYNSDSRTIYTGPRGGKYYINSKGNKTYIKKKK